MLQGVSFFVSLVFSFNKNTFEIACHNVIIIYYLDYTHNDLPFFLIFEYKVHSPLFGKIVVIKICNKKLKYFVT